MSEQAKAVQSALAEQLPDARGHFGPYGGRFVAETLMGPLEELRVAYERYIQDPAFLRELDEQLHQYVGRPSPLYLAERWSDMLGGARVYLKREDLNHTGAHKINNTVGQALLAKRMGKTRVIAETGAGQHGVATATVAARLGMECVVYMGAEDIKRQAINVFRMKLLGATVVPVESGSKTLKDALNEAMRDWVTNVDHTFYIIGTVAGPHPYPAMVRDFQAVIGREAREQVLAQAGRLPDALVACVGGGSNAIGLFHPFLNDTEVKLYGVEAAGEGLSTGHHAAPLCAGRPGVLHRNPLDLRRSRLSRRRARARVVEGQRTRRVRRHYRCRSTGGVSRVDAHGRHYSGAGVEPRIGLRAQAGPDSGSRRHHHCQLVRSRRQGHSYGRDLGRHLCLTRPLSVQLKTPYGYMVHESN